MKYNMSKFMVQTKLVSWITSDSRCVFLTILS